ncbi:MAG: restriction endonuclease subunit S [Acidobacteria bacterium]|nr:restriction endonuclease subunit S [Acidobacteriota bacterium]
MNPSASNEIPTGWAKTRLRDVLPLTYGKGLTENNRDREGSVPVYGSSGVVGWHSHPLTSGATLVIGRKGSAGEVHHSPVPCWPIDTAYYVEATDSVHMPYFAYLLKTVRLGQLDKSTTIPSLRREDFSSIEIPVAPADEQRRIVSEIEKQFTRLDAAVAALKRVQANLKRYRAAVLKAACEGCLVPTEAELARAERRDYELADRLLARILKERRARWEVEQLARMKAAGKPPQDDKWKAKYQEPTTPDVAHLPSLPEGWSWATLSQMSWDASYGTSEKCDHGWSGPPVLRIPNVVRGKVDLADLKFAAPSTDLSQSDALAPGDMLIVRTNGSRDLIGRSAVVDSLVVQQPHFYASYLIRCRLVDLGGVPKWVGTIWDASSNRARIEALAATTAGQYNVNLAKLGTLPIPLAANAEMERIVGETERRFSVIEELEMQADANLKRAHRLRQSILKRAFEGNLVPQDPNDEPATVLLERIRCERAQIETERAQQRKQALRRVKKAAAVAAAGSDA